MVANAGIIIPKSLLEIDVKEFNTVNTVGKAPTTWS